MSDAMMDLLSRALGSGGGSDIRRLQEAGQSVQESFLQPQPVGLTNIQCKVIGPYFTNNPQHRHPEVDPSVVSALHYELPANPQQWPTEASGLSTAELLGQEHGQDAEATNDEDEMQLMLLVSILDDKAVQGDFSTLSLAFRAATEIKDQLNEDEMEIYSAVEQKMQAKAVFVPLSTFGHKLERALSVACVGRECHWNALCKALLRAFDDDRQLSVAVSYTGAQIELVKSFRPYLDTGLPVPIEGLWSLFALASRVVHRPLVLLCNTKGKEDFSTYVVLPVETPAEKRSRRPIVFRVEGQAITGVVLPTATSPDASSGPVRLAVRGHLSIFPVTVNNPTEYIDIDQEGDQKYFQLNASCTGHTAADDTSLDAACAKMTGYDPKVQSFNSFPPSCFALADTPEVAEILRQSEGFGDDRSGTQDYLATELAQTRNMTAVHVDADGHCLTHSVSRCLVGKEYFWHALRTQLHLTMIHEKDKYIEHFKKNEQLVGLEDEFDALTDRAHPDNCGEEGQVIALSRGLGAEHLFVMANILRRPILLLDRKDTPQPQGFVFLPLLVPPEACSTKKLIVVGWNNEAHQHYVPIIPLVAEMLAVVELSGFPRSQSEKGELLVYACPDDASSEELLRSYVELTEVPAAGDVEGSVEAAVVGGEVALDTRGWCQGIMDLYAREKGYSIWAVQEVARHLLKRAAFEAADLAVIRSIHEFDRLVSDIVSQSRLFYCPVCTSTTDTPDCCSRGAGVEFNYLTGRIDYPDGCRVPLESVPGYSCCVYKHWHATEPKEVKVGSPVFARDVGSVFQLGVVSRVYKARDMFDIRFRAGSTASLRYCCPVEDIMFGFPTDMQPRKYRLGRGAATTVRSVIYDADERLRTDPKTLTEDVLETITKKLQPQERTAAVINALRERLIEDITTLQKNDAKAAQQCLRKRQATASISNQKVSSSSQSNAEHREPRMVDDNGRRVLWESMDPRTQEWIPYEDHVSGQMEAAFHAKDPSYLLEIQGFGAFTIHFRSFVQENSLGYGRPVRRLALSTWNCPNCTLELEGNIEQCFLCAGEGITSHRPESAAEVTDAKTEHRRRLAEIEKQYADEYAALDEFDEEDEEEYEEVQKLEARCKADKELRKGGLLYNTAMEQTDGKPTGRVVAFGAYGKNYFLYLPEPMDRFVVLPTMIKDPNHYLLPVIRSGHKKRVYGQTLYTIYGVQYLEEGGGRVYHRLN